MQECPPISYRICHNRILFYLYSIDDNYLMATCLFFPTGRSSYSASPTRESSHTHFWGHKHYFRPINSSMVNTFILHLSILLLTFPQWLTVILTFLWRLVISKMLFYKYYHLMNLFKVVPFLVRKIIFQPLTMIL